MIIIEANDIKYENKIKFVLFDSADNINIIYKGEEIAYDKKEIISLAKMIIECYK